jgi:dTDP-4-dehydrorhamnose reductase
MTIVVLGRTGQVGWELQRALAPLGTVVALGRDEADLSRPKAIAGIVEALRPRLIINAAAYTAVDKAESDPDAADAVNHRSVGELAALAVRSGAGLIHYSTDYVFDGSKDGRYREDDPTAPVNLYGRTKLAGEDAIRASGCAHLIFRTSWVYARRGANFAATMLRLAHERETLRVVADQIGAPAGAELIADVTAQCLARLGGSAQGLSAVSGIYNLAPAGEISWHGYARFVTAEATAAGAVLKATPDAVHPIATADYPTPARRPHNSRLDLGKIERTFGLVMPDWRPGVARVVREWVEAGRFR